jgi:hypothetical protein
MIDYFDITCQLVDSGLSVVPLQLNGSRRPAIDELEPYFDRQPLCKELHEWFFGKSEAAYAIIGGIVSRGLEVMDFDDGTLFEPWREQVADIVERLPVISTPGEGFHIYYRCCEIAPAAKIAIDPSREKATLIETRGERSYVAAPGSHPKTHPTGRRYRRFSGPSLLCIPTISPKDRRRLWAAARTFDKRPAKQIESLRQRVNGYASKQCTDSRPLGPRKESASRYVAKMEPSISGCDGHGKAFTVACVLVGKFGLPFDESLEIFHEYNKRCAPPWSEKEILHKLESAMEAAK